MASNQANLNDPAFLGEAPIDGGVALNPITPSVQGNWPRLIKFDKEIEKRLSQWIEAELDGFYIERQDILADWRRFQTLYWATPATEEKNFPFRRAANIVIPLAAIAVEAHFARFMSTLFSVEPFWSIRPKAKEWIEAAKPFERYLQSEVQSNESLQMYEFCSDAIPELLKLGTVVGKSGYEKLTKRSVQSSGVAGEEEQVIYATVKNGATVARVPLGNFIMRLAELDPQTAPIVGETHEFTWSQLKQMAQSGRMRASEIEKIKHWYSEKNLHSDSYEGKSVQEEVNKNANTEPQWFSIFKVRELWLSVDIDGSGWDSEIVVDYHRESGTFLSARYNWNPDLHRPYRIASCVNVEGIWPGIGICKQAEQFQNEATTIHRQRLDNATLANMSQMVLRKGMGYGPGESIFPGKMWFVDDPSRDIKEFKLSEVYPSSYANEHAVINFYEQRTGVNEVVLGQAHEGTPGTATGDLTRLAEGNKRFDLILRNIKRWLSLIGVDVVSNMQKFGNQQVHWLLDSEEEAGYVEMILNMPPMLVRKGALVELNVTDSITNKEVEQGQWLQLFQVMTSYYDRATSYAQMIAETVGDPTPFLQMAERALLVSDETLRRLLETYNIPDLDRFTLVEKPSAGAESGQNGQGAVNPGQTTNRLGGTVPTQGMGPVQGPS